MKTSLTQRLASVHERIQNAALACGRAPETVRLVAISKFHPISAVREVYDAGQVDFGESYIQEALAKQDESTDLAIAWHFVGKLQKNKAKFAVGRFALIHAVDSLELATTLERRASEHIVQDILIQVNLAREPQKSGVMEEKLDALVEGILELHQVRLQGFMVMPPFSDDPETSRPFFRRLFETRERIGREFGINLPHLSMGMSGDLEVAVEEGATLVRVGTDIFGPRPVV
ncbi:YggS family pyridoxal phosphate-dependent enzyme [Desulfovibrio inopinatus]|uniref:YggS family pyridoxal phosphate-dependent enzyme n=1 Tax=Desulfovibrio inopinatus TaxID=102109 RepID=UPI000410D8E5|nr:YggS family pyridoxal phosphate-dependent enzyme [Desulfovibrio inopinatus]